MTKRLAASALILIAAVAGAWPQQPTILTGSSSITGASSLGARTLNTRVWAFSPPNSTNDNTYFQTAVMPQASVAGVSLVEDWSSIEVTKPISTPCTDTTPDHQQLDSIGMYHCYDWTIYDSVAGGNRIMQWFGTFGASKKLVNLLFLGTATSATNGGTPNYVTTSGWFTNAGFVNPYNRQDVINTLKDCTTVPYKGTLVSSGITWSGTTVTVSLTGCCSTAMNDQSNLLHTGDIIYATGSPAGIGTDPALVLTASVSASNIFSYISMGTAGTAVNLTYISASQSWPVPYEEPYKVALKAFWAAAIAHYQPSFSNFNQLNYFRFDGSAGSEWFPYCVHNTSTNGLVHLTAPYTYVKSGGVAGTSVGWLDYYSEMLDHLQSLQPPVKIIMSINSADTGPVDYDYADQEAGLSIQRVNAYGVHFGFGSQGLSALDHKNCTGAFSCGIGSTTPSASDWFPLFAKYRGLGVALELQPLSLSYEGDLDCSSPTCGPGNGNYSGDLPTFLFPFATDDGMTDTEIYWRDLDLAYDAANYCTLSALGPPYTCASGISLGGQLATGQGLTFFQAVGQAMPMVPNTCIAGFPYQSNAAGSCAYATNIDSAEGPH